MKIEKDIALMEANGWDKYVLDVTLDPPRFCPRADGVVWVVYRFVKCPGKWVGLVHRDGQGAIDKWTEQNPNWRVEYDITELSDSRDIAGKE